MLKDNITLYSLSLPLAEQENLEKMNQYHKNSFLSDVNDMTDQKDILLIDDDGKPVRWIPFASLLKAIVDQWKNLSILNDTVLRAVDDAITIVDNEGKVIAWNPKAEELYETTTEEMLGKPITDFFKEESVVLMSTLKEKSGVVRQYNQPQSGVHVLINTLPMMKDDQLIGGISVERDITDVVKLNDELTTTTAYIRDLESKIEMKHIDDSFHKIKGRSQALSSAIHLAKKVAVTDATVLITGESGVGKELFAQAIHNESPRSNEPFVDLNCGAIPAALFESELFGYEKGAFTGAIKEGKIGKIDVAKGGTLFLDEIGELPLELQVKLLRVLQEKEFYRVGGTSPIPIDVRIISATNRNLEEMIEEGLFREDLFYRLNVVSIHIPPLRERIEDIPELIQLFLKEFSIKYKKPVPIIDPEVMVTFMHFPWNGNIRQLKNTIERMMILADEDVIKSDHLPSNFVLTKRNEPVNSPINEIEPSGLHDEKSSILFALQKTYGNKSAAAKLLGISRVTLYNKMKKYNIYKP
ncbi:sigma 54-interacting transcriptional regulator [Bacillus aquiflavi]|uniref:PAS domain-containing protein n=1 Tax=Bacillus aquiflavi TaxID=2672567 RepID=A0A6B3VXR9_9BACI|nr:sigma 54-interacting transcriptional regulator [Bacillus aquiflavi]MBA4535951.1 sigma 54-interacting transcriptional regulator [Bacillus aquiflavi]NEY80326.1 PAS domain-containing protein [Bacillus aquiflavi]UAC49809.1 sigma 54-interacting transcriptional regulator [Bacillus aquiflavi]